MHCFLVHMLWNFKCSRKAKILSVSSTIVVVFYSTTILLQCAALRLLLLQAYFGVFFPSSALVFAEIGLSHR